MDKYKGCCGKRCMVHGCKIKDSGGCYCVCRLKDAENQCLNLLDGQSYRQNGGIIYVPGRYQPLEGDERKETETQLENIRSRLKEYEIKE
jgi:hypothetical protein